MWQKEEHENVHSIERLDVLSALRRKGLGRALLNDAIKHIKVECPQACIDILAEPDPDSDIAIDVLVKFYESVGFEKYQHFSKNRVHFRLYLDESVKPDKIYDISYYFRYERPYL